MCGVFGVCAPDRDVARLTYFGLFALQHRGQESAGIAVSEDGRLTALRDLGLVTQVFDEQKLHGLPRRARDRPHALLDDRLDRSGRTRSRSSSTAARARSRSAHNGNLIERDRAARRARRRRRDARDDAPTPRSIAALIANDDATARRGGRARDARGSRARTRSSRSRRATLIALPRPARLPAARRSAGSTTTGSSRPRRARSTSSARGSSARSSRGELVLIDEHGLRVVQAVAPASAGALCIFEFFYLARPDTRLAGVEVHGARVRMGERLAAGGAGRRRPRPPDARLGHARRDRLLARDSASRSARA